MTIGKDHSYSVNIRWTGNTGEGTSSYRGYLRDHEISVTNKALIAGSADPKFRGDDTRHNPEELLVAALSACHMLSYLHQCNAAGIIVVAYEDQAQGSMSETDDGGGHFTSVTLHPAVRIKEGGNTDLALELHEKAHQLCFIARSVNFPVLCEASIEVE
jgi:organic hydroperoxide reductase OsmC/OhrA